MKRILSLLFILPLFAVAQQTGQPAGSVIKAAPSWYYGTDTTANPYFNGKYYPLVTTQKGDARYIKNSTSPTNQNFNLGTGIGLAHSIGVRDVQPNLVEDVGIWSNVSGTGGSTGVLRAGQFYANYTGANAFTGIDVQTTVNTTVDANHVVSSQNNTILNNSANLLNAYGVFSAGSMTGSGTVNNAYGFYHQAWSDTSNKIAKKWSFYATGDYMYLSAGSGIAINTFTPQEMIDMDFGDGNGYGAKFANAWVGNYSLAGAIASFGHYAMKTVNGGLSLLQLADGTTFLNSNHGKSVYLTSGLTNAARITPSSNVQIGPSVNDALADSGDPLQVYGTSLHTGDIKFNTIGTNINFNNAGSNRWNITYDGAESTGDAGSDLKIYNYHDNGTLIGTALSINRANGTVTTNTIAASSVNPNATPTTVSGSTSGDISASQPLQGTAYKLVFIKVTSLNGSATYTYPSAFTAIPFVTQSGGSITVDTSSNSQVIITSTGNSGYIKIEGY